MKRIKHKRFKKHSDLIHYATKRAIHRCDTEATTYTIAVTEANKPDFLEEARRKAKGLR